MSDRSASGLLEECLREDRDEVWSEFVRRFGVRLTAGVRQALRRSGAAVSRDRVEDLVQDVYCSLIADGRRRLACCRAREEGQVAAYLRRVAENVALDRLREAAAEKRGAGRLVALAADEVAEAAARVAAPDASPEEGLLGRERRTVFLRACREVLGHRSPERDLRVLRLALLEGWTSREIAARFDDLTPSSVDSLVHRVKSRLARRGLEVPRRRAQE